jgi:hypothetical protein
MLIRPPGTPGLTVYRRRYDRLKLQDSSHMGELFDLFTRSHVSDIFISPTYRDQRWVLVGTWPSPLGTGRARQTMLEPGVTNTAKLMYHIPEGVYRIASCSLHVYARCVSDPIGL